MAPMDNSETDDDCTTVDEDEYLQSMHRDLVGKRQGIQEQFERNSRELFSMSMTQIDRVFDNELMDVLLWEGKDSIPQVLQCISTCGAEEQFESVLLDVDYCRSCNKSRFFVQGFILFFPFPSCPVI